MIARIHQKLGTAGFVISIVALVAALCGGAYAAGGGLNGKQKKQVKKIAKRYAGKNGAQGAQGPPGANGAPGAKGDAGAPGANGSNGANGKGLSVSTENPGANCAEGGLGVEVEGSGAKQYVCNGEEGEPGTTGYSPVLPPGETETGAWGVGKFTTEQEENFTQTVEPISFPFPLPAGNYPFELVSKGGPTTAHCTGTVAEPTADPGFICFYESVNEEGPLLTSVHQPGSEVEEEGADGTGAIVTFVVPKENGYVYGTWAITAPLS